jgi:hypothetical protein
MLAEIYVGPASGSGPKATQPLNGDKNTNSLWVARRHAPNYEMAKTGNLWTLATAVAGVTVAAANVFSSVAPFQPIVGIINPAGSGYDMVIIRASIIWNGGTPAAGGVVWCTLGVSATGLVTAAGGNGAINNYTFAVGGSKAKTFVNSALTGNTTVAASLLDYINGPSTGALAANSFPSGIDAADGRIVVPQGCFLGIGAGAAGTSPIINASMTWLEEPV